MTRKYTSDNIVILTGLDGVRNSASMYMGSTDESGVFLTARELIDNIIDEYLERRANTACISLLPDGSIMVLDDGNGVPQGHKVLPVTVNGKVVKSKMPTMQAIFGELHTSGKYNADAYKSSIGTHGVGAKGTNATSEFFKVWTVFEGRCYHVAFEKGKLVTPVKTAAMPQRTPFGAPKKGTLIHYKPDPEIYGNAKFPAHSLRDYANIISKLNPGLRIKEYRGSKLEAEYFSKDGPLDYLVERYKELKCKPITDKYVDIQLEICDVVVGFTDAPIGDVRGFIHGLHNTDGGVHVDAVYKAAYDAAKEYEGARQKGKYTTLTFREGLVGLISVKLHKPEFAGQNKAKLRDKRIDSEFVKQLTAEFAAFYADNKALVRDLIKRACAVESLRERFALRADDARKMRTFKEKGLPIKYLGASGRTKPQDRELYLVEGDSAGGSAKKARMEWQGVLPLKGKTPNPWTTKNAASNNELLMYQTAMGYEAKAEDPMANAKYGKVIIMSDPDADGSHIRTLLIAAMLTITPEVIERGLVYVTMLPEFYAIKNKKYIVGDSVDEVVKKLKGTKAPVKHMKGLGEAPTELLREICMHPDTRRLVRVMPTGTRYVQELMGSSPHMRKEMIGLEVGDGE